MQRQEVARFAGPDASGRDKNHGLWSGESRLSKALYAAKTPLPARLRARGPIASPRPPISTNDAIFPKFAS